MSVESWGEGGGGSEGIPGAKPSTLLKGFLGRNSIVPELFLDHGRTLDNCVFL